MRKMLPLTMSLALAAGIVSACSNTKSSNDAGQTAASSGTSPSSSAAAAPSNTITYNMFRNFNAPEYPADGGPAKKVVLDALTKAGITGIDFNVSMASGPDYATKLNLQAASGNLPDYFSIDVQTMARFADQGLILPLDDLLKNAPNVMKVIKQDDLNNLKYNGKIYALPVGYRPEPFNGPNTNGLVIRKDWLDNLGLKVPTTLDELHDVLKAFVSQDPDKNGKNDTVGLTSDKTTFFNFVFGAFGVIPAASNGAGGQALYWTERNGQLKPDVVLPETKQALALLQSWYKEGLIDPEFPVMERKQVEEKVINSKTGVYEGSAFEGDPKQPVFSSLLKALPTAKLELIAPPAGKDGKKGWPENAPSYGDVRAISAKAKDPARLMKMIDWSIGEGFNLVTYGVEGKDYTLDEAKNKVNMKVSSYSDLYKQGFSNPIRFLQVLDRRWMTDDSIKGMMIANDQKNIIKNEFWKTVPAMTDYPDLTKLWSEYFAKIVTGAYPVDKFDEFVQKFAQQGGQEIEKQVNAEWKKSGK